MFEFLAGCASMPLLFAAYFLFQEFRSKRCHWRTQRGKYRDPCSPFRIVAPPEDVERSEVLIAREARRGMKERVAS